MQEGRGGGGILLNVSSLHGKRRLFCGLRFSDRVGVGAGGRTSAAAEGGGFSTKRRRRLGFASARSALQEENLEICSYAAITPLPPSLKQPRNVRAALKPLSVLPHCRKRAPRAGKKKVFLCRD